MRGRIILRKCGDVESVLRSFIERRYGLIVGTLVFTVAAFGPTMLDVRWEVS